MADKDRVVAHAAIFFNDSKTKEMVTVMRGREVDTSRIPKERLEALIASGAFAPEGTEPMDVWNAGNMRDFRPDFTEQELLAWVRDASGDEIVAAAADHAEDDVLISRILDAEGTVAHAMQRAVRQSVVSGIQTVVSQHNT